MLDIWTFCNIHSICHKCNTLELLTHRSDFTGAAHRGESGPKAIIYFFMCIKYTFQDCDWCIMGRICATLSSCVLDQAWPQCRFRRFEDKGLAEKDTTTCMTVKWGFCFLTQLECKALSQPLLLCNADKEEKKTFTRIQRVQDTETCSVAYLGNTNVLVSAIFQHPEATDGPTVCLIISPTQVVDFSILLSSFFIWANSGKNWSYKLLHVSGVFFGFYIF